MVDQLHNVHERSSTDSAGAFTGESHLVSDIFTAAIVEEVSETGNDALVGSYALQLIPKSAGRNLITLTHLDGIPVSDGSPDGLSSGSGPNLGFDVVALPPIRRLVLAGSGTLSREVGMPGALLMYAFDEYGNNLRHVAPDVNHEAGGGHSNAFTSSDADISLLEHHGQARITASVDIIDADTQALASRATLTCYTSSSSASLNESSSDLLVSFTSTRPVAACVGSWTSERAGSYFLQLTELVERVGGANVSTTSVTSLMQRERPMQVTIAPGPVHSSTTKLKPVWASQQDTSVAEAGSPMKMLVSFRDSFDNVIPCASLVGDPQLSIKLLDRVGDQFAVDNTVSSEILSPDVVSDASTDALRVACSDESENLILHVNVTASGEYRIQVAHTMFGDIAGSPFDFDVHPHGEIDVRRSAVAYSTTDDTMIIGTASHSSAVNTHDTSGTNLTPGMTSEEDRPLPLPTMRAGEAVTLTVMTKDKFGNPFVVSGDSEGETWYEDVVKQWSLRLKYIDSLSPMGGESRSKTVPFTIAPGAFPSATISLTAIGDAILQASIPPLEMPGMVVLSAVHGESNAMMADRTSSGRAGDHGLHIRVIPGPVNATMSTYSLHEAAPFVAPSFSMSDSSASDFSNGTSKNVDASPYASYTIDVKLRDRFGNTVIPTAYLAANVKAHVLRVTPMPSEDDDTISADLETIAATTTTVSPVPMGLSHESGTSIRSLSATHLPSDRNSSSSPLPSSYSTSMSIFVEKAFLKLALHLLLPRRKSLCVTIRRPTTMSNTAMGSMKKTNRMMVRIAMEEICSSLVASMLS